MTEATRKLSTVLLVSSARFAALSATAQTAALAKAEGLPVEFVPNFVALSDPKRLRDRLISGQDVSRELEFNGIELTAEERRVMTLVAPILEKIGALRPVYPWLPEQDFSSTISISGFMVGRNGHQITKSKFGSLWMTASRYWAGGAKPKHQNHRIKEGYYSTTKTVEFLQDAVKIGCQTIPRSEVEYIARTLNVDPTVD